MNLNRRHLLGCALPLAAAIGAPTAWASAATKNLLTREAGARVHSFSSEHGAGWIAANLVPSADAFKSSGAPRQDMIWSSAPNAPFPHWIQFDLGRDRWITGFSFDNALEDEADHPGISARLVEVHAGIGANQLARVASFELERNRRDQTVSIEPVQARHLRLIITSNWGHPWYTELGASQVFDDGRRPGNVAQQLASGRPLDVYGIYFDFAKASIRPESATVLERVASAIKGLAGRRFVVEGHTDDTGAAALNLELSRKRSEAVVAELVRLGVPRAALSATGYGSTKPLASNATPDGRAKNRRVTLAPA